MNAKQIFQGLKTNQITSKYIRGVFPLNLLEKHGPVVPYTDNAYICNTAVDSHPGQHWVAIFIDTNSRGEYFDSYGLPPNPVFARFLNTHCREWIWNDVTFQSPFTAVCGQYCMYFVYCKSCGYSMREIANNLLHSEDYDKHVFDFVKRKFQGMGRTELFPVSYFIKQICQPMQANRHLFCNV